MARFNLDDYVDVAERIEQFYELYPNGRLVTQLLNIAGWNGKQTQFIVASMAYDGTELLATGLAEESFGPSGANQTSPLENAETSSLGRCLANLGLAKTRSGKRQRPTRQEMEKVNRGPSPVDPSIIDLKGKMAEKFSDAVERKEWLESVVGRELSGVSELTPEEVQNALANLTNTEPIKGK
jgi:hypothetical protein